MKVREFQIPDYPHVCEWWRAHKGPFPGGHWPMIPLEFLSNSGFIAEDDDGERVAAGWLYLTNSAWSLLEFAVSNPNASIKKRHKGLELIVEEVARVTKDLGLACFTSLKSRGLKKLYERHGFGSAETGMINLVLPKREK